MASNLISPLFYLKRVDLSKKISSFLSDCMISDAFVRDLVAGGLSFAPQAHGNRNLLRTVFRPSHRKENRPGIIIGHTQVKGIEVNPLESLITGHLFYFLTKTIFNKPPKPADSSWTIFREVAFRIGPNFRLILVARALVKRFRIFRPREGV